jgi:hypothetical protein
MCYCDNKNYIAEVYFTGLTTVIMNVSGGFLERNSK